MQRFIMSELIKWKNRPDRRPLILRGARQTGKTYILTKFGQENYENIAYFNFDQQPELGSFFEKTKDPNRILEQLALAAKTKISPEKTLIFFDEIQECPNALNSLKYFQEFAPEYHIVCAGSLLGIRLAHTSFPVGKVNFLDLHPMSFKEFLLADSCENLVAYLDQVTLTTSEPLFNQQLEEKLRIYFIVGGMPAVVSSWVKEKNIDEVNRIQSEILSAYEADFSKHTTPTEANKISLIWNSLPSQLARENKKFLYQTIKTGARAREYEDALNWLNRANLIHKVYNVSAPKLPLKAYEDLSAFKIYLGDVGLLRHLSELDSEIITQKNALFEEFKGAYAENYIINTLALTSPNTPHYFTFDRHELDFLVQYHAKLIPIEVKSNKTTNNTSLTNFNSLYSPDFAIRFSMRDLKLDDKILNIPLYMASEWSRLCL